MGAIGRDDADRQTDGAGAHAREERWPEVPAANQVRRGLASVLTQFGLPQARGADVMAA